MAKVLLNVRNRMECNISKYSLLILLVILLLTSVKTQAQNCSVNAGIDQTICANEPLFLDGSFTPPIKAGEQVIWTQIGGPAATIVDPTDLGTQVTNIIAGNTYTFRIYTTCADGALTYQDVSHTVKAITIASAGPDATYCPGTNVGTLFGNAPGVNETGEWTGGASAGITINDRDNPVSTITLSPSASGAATLTWTITNSVTGCSSSDQVVITNRGGVMPVDAGGNQTLDNCYSTTQSTNLSGTYAGVGIDGQIGTWTVVSGPNVPIISNPNVHNTSISNLIQGTYVFRWTVTGICASGSDLVTITVPAPTADVTDANVIGGNQVFCDPTTTSTILSGSSPLYINEAVEWRLVSKSPGAPDPVITNPTNPVTSVTGLVSPYSYTFSYTINNSETDCSSAANVTVSYLPDPPTLSINDTDPILLSCGENSANINFTAGGSGTNAYRIISGPGIGYPNDWTNIGSSPLVISGLTEIGTYVVEMRRVSTVGSASACGTVYDLISIVTSNLSTAANAGTDQMLNCNVTATELIGNVPAVGQGTWSQVSGPIVIILTSPHSPTLGITGLTAEGEYVFRWVISGGPVCTPTQDDVLVRTASTVPSSPNAGIDQNVCVNTPVYLNANPRTYVFELGTWTVSPIAGVVISDIHDPKAVVTGLQANTSYTFTWKMANGCGSAGDDMIVNVSDEEGPIASNAGDDQCIVSGTTSITLAGNNPSPGAGTWTKISGPDATITDDNLFNTTVTGLSNGNYVFEWSIESGGCTPTKDSVTVTIDEPIQTFNAGEEQRICGVAPITATLTSSLGAQPTIGTGRWSQISGNATTITSPDNYTTTVTGIVAGSYIYRYTITNGACSEYDDVTLLVSEQGSVANIADATIGVCGASTTTLTADPITLGTGYWSLISGPNTPTIVSTSNPVTIINGLITGSYIFKWTVSGGPFCASTSDEVTVNVTQSANAGSDQSYCDAITAVNLTGTIASSVLQHLMR